MADIESEEVKNLVSVSVENEKCSQLYEIFIKNYIFLLSKEICNEKKLKWFIE